LPNDIQQFASTFWLHQPSVFKQMLATQIKRAGAVPYNIFHLSPPLTFADTSHEEFKEIKCYWAVLSLYKKVSKH